MRDQIRELCKCSEIVFLPWWMVSRWTLTVDVESMLLYRSKNFVSWASKMARSRSKSCMRQDITLSSKLLLVTWIMFLCISSYSDLLLHLPLFLLLFVWTLLQPTSGSTYLSRFLNLLGKDYNKENMTLSNMAYHRSLKQEPLNMSLDLDLGAKLNCQVFFFLGEWCLFFFLDRRPPKTTIARGKSS